MSIVKNIDDVKNHAITNYNFSWDTIRPVVKKVERKHIRSILGRDQYKNFENNPQQEESQKEVLELCKEASVNLALLSYSKIGMINISDQGFTITSSQHTKTPEWWQVRDLRRELLNTAMEALDEALKVMESNIADFPKWKESNSYTYFSELFVRHTETFNRYYNINDSRLTFVRLRPHLLKVEDKYFKGLLGSETMELIKATESDAAKEALRICQAAQVNLTVAEVAKEGSFIFADDYLRVFTDEIPGEKNIINFDKRDAIIHQKNQAGNEYLRNLIKHLEANPDQFEEFKERKKNKVVNPVHNTRSIVSF